MRHLALIFLLSVAVASAQQRTFLNMDTLFPIDGTRNITNAGTVTNMTIYWQQLTNAPGVTNLPITIVVPLTAGSYTFTAISWATNATIVAPNFASDVFNVDLDYWDGIRQFNLSNDIGPFFQLQFGSEETAGPAGTLTGNGGSTSFYPFPVLIGTNNLTITLSATDGMNIAGFTKIWIKRL